MRYNFNKLTVNLLNYSVMKKLVILFAIGIVFSLTSCNPEAINDEQQTTTIDDGEITDDDI